MTEQAKPEPALQHLPYLDREVSYFLGLIFAGGFFRSAEDFTTLTILIPWLRTSGKAEISADSAVRGRMRMLDIRSRLDELIEFSPRILETARGRMMRFVIRTQSLAFRNLALLCRGCRQQKRWELHPLLLSASRNVQRQFLLGLAEASGGPISEWLGKRPELRVRNRALGLQVCRLLQETFNIRAHVRQRPSARGTLGKSVVVLPIGVQSSGSCGLGF
jgi:hypothetical protein